VGSLFPHAFGLRPPPPPCGMSAKEKEMWSSARHCDSPPLHPHPLQRTVRTPSTARPRRSRRLGASRGTRMPPSPSTRRCVPHIEDHPNGTQRNSPQTAVRAQARTSCTHRLLCDRRTGGRRGRDAGQTPQIFYNAAPSTQFPPNRILCGLVF